MKSMINRRGSKAAARTLKHLGTPRRTIPAKNIKRAAAGRCCREDFESCKPEKGHEMTAEQEA